MRLVVILVAALLAAPAAAGEFVGRLSAKEISWIRVNQDRLRAQLKDGESARFRNLFVSRAGGAPVACGEVNAKNALGGYAGFQRWLGAGSVGQFLETEVDDFRRVWASFCRR